MSGDTQRHALSRGARFAPQLNAKTNRERGRKSMKQNPLIGKTLTGMRIADDRQALLFQTTDGELVVDVDADCCSYTWVEGPSKAAIATPAHGIAAANAQR